MTIQIRMTDESQNEVIQSWSDKFVDAKRPTVSIFSPSSSTDGSKYLHGNNINVLVGAEDDVMIAEFQYRFTYHYGGVTGQTLSTEWSDLTGITDVEGDGSAVTANMDVAAGNFGTLPNLANELEAIQTLQDDYITAMVENTKFTRKKLEKLLNEKVNIYLSAEEAVKYGLADEIM